MWGFKLCSSEMTLLLAAGSKKLTSLHRRSRARALLDDAAHRKRSALPDPSVRKTQKSGKVRSLIPGLPTKASKEGRQHKELAQPPNNDRETVQRW